MNHSSLKYINGFSEIFNNNISEELFIKIDFLPWDVLIESTEKPIHTEVWPSVIKNENQLNSLYKKILKLYKKHLGNKDSRHKESSYIKNIVFDISPTEPKIKWTIRISNHKGVPKEENENIKSFITKDVAYSNETFHHSKEFYVPSERWPLKYKGNDGITMKEIIEDISGLTKIVITLLTA